MLNCSTSVCKNAMNGTINRISAEEVVLYEGGKMREVKCEMEVISWREHRVESKVEVNALMDYERLADFIPQSYLYDVKLTGRGYWKRHVKISSSYFWETKATNGDEGK
ncbi:hypothetical protein L6452_27567 [Arctium lappa]|uniref:Uncharacterized protein n=1 Tax=Arctium lappa TaxID=4217 RepID=A0ACB8ZXB0_ARCLA|nr:hypothetical protein L6452_27567 [Arctium lappa]